MKKLMVFAIFALVVMAAGCSSTSNENANMNTNANTASNANMANTNANAPKKGTREDYEKNKQSYAEQAKALGRKIGTGLDDGWLWTKTRFDLAAADDLRDSTINVDVENGVVTLTGTVETAAQKAKAESIAKSVEGVKQVKNMLKVAPAGNANKANQKANPPAKGKKY
jgi:hyperosmotically inducible periplasmic protein